jgi:hypothetical protein
MIFVENTYYLNEIEKYIEKENRIINYNEESNFNQINNFRQLFSDYWFSEENLPLFYNEKTLLSILFYFIFKIKKISKKHNLNIERLIRINTLYSNFSEQIINFIEKGNKIIINNIQNIFLEIQFFKTFLSILGSNLDNFQKKYLYISKVK